MTRPCVVLSATLVLGLVPVAWSAPQDSAATRAAQTPSSRLITYSGALHDAEGHARPGSVIVVFSLYAQQDGGEALWRERQTVTADALGQYTVLLGATVPGGVPPDAFGDARAQWLGVAVEGEAEQARALLVAVPYALKAADAETLGGKPIASFVLSSDLEETVARRLASVTTGTGGVVAVGTGTVGTLGNESGSNTTYGEGAGNLVMTGTYNAFFGYHAGQSDDTGWGNAFFGAMAGYNDNAGTFNAFFGHNAGFTNTAGHANAFFGEGAGYSNNASANSFFGQNAGYATTTGESNAFFGQAAGYNNNASYNAFFGRNAGYANTTGTYNTFIGSFAGTATTIGDANVFVGRRAGKDNINGAYNTAVGAYAGQSNTTGSGNVFIGAAAGDTSTTEQGNTFVGADADMAAGITNATAIGFEALVTQSDSVVLGSVAGVNSATVTANVGIGTTAPTARLHVVGDVKTGDNLTGPNNVVMGTGTALPAWSGNVEFNNEVGVGFHFRTLNARFDIGPGSSGAPTYPGLLTLSMDGKVGIGTTSPAYKLHVAGDIYTTGTYQGSDLRLKDQVHDLGYGVREVLRLRPVSYRWKDAALARPTLGLIAQEVEPVLPELVARGTDEAGLLSVNYTGLIPVLVKAMQEQQAALAQKDSELAAFTGRLVTLERKDAEIAALTARLAALEQQMQLALKRQNPSEK